MKQRKKPARKSWCVYLLRCADDTLYCGVTNDLPKRLAAHNSGTGARYTRSRGPVVLVWCKKCRTKPAAFKAEYAIKLLSRAEKTRMVAVAKLKAKCK